RLPAHRDLRNLNATQNLMASKILAHEVPSRGSGGPAAEQVAAFYQGEGGPGGTVGGEFDGFVAVAVVAVGQQHRVPVGGGFDRCGMVPGLAGQVPGFWAGGSGLAGQVPGFWGGGPGLAGQVPGFWGGGPGLAGQVPGFWGG